ncbi:hypothetical protein TUM12370_18220 [Salmonella enterica subsp. enterica serovar Choleraesuis]|nr:hypothetical protein TUM12370_18220 [Salmonella enterica subsp. enterica serovar Choleraesuis]
MQTTTAKKNGHRLGWSDVDIRYRWALTLLGLTLIGGMGWSSFYHHSQFVIAESARVAALSKSEVQQKTINDLTAREKALIEMDSRRNQELADARATIQRLQGVAEKSHM